MCRFGDMIKAAEGNFNRWARYSWERATLGLDIDCCKGYAFNQRIIVRSVASEHVGENPGSTEPKPHPDRGPDPPQLHPKRSCDFSVHAVRRSEQTDRRVFHVRCAPGQSLARAPKLHASVVRQLFHLVSRSIREEGVHDSHQRDRRSAIEPGFD